MEVIVGTEGTISRMFEKSSTRCWTEKKLVKALNEAFDVDPSKESIVRLEIKINEVTARIRKHNEVTIYENSFTFLKSVLSVPDEQLNEYAKNALQMVSPSKTFEENKRMIENVLLFCSRFNQASNCVISFLEDHYTIFYAGNSSILYNKSSEELLFRLIELFNTNFKKKI